MKLTTTQKNAIYERFRNVIADLPDDEYKDANERIHAFIFKSDNSIEETSCRPFYPTTRAILRAFMLGYELGTTSTNQDAALDEQPERRQGEAETNPTSE